VSERTRAQQQRRPERSSDRPAEPTRAHQAHARTTSPAVGTHDVSRVAVGGSEPRTLWRRTPDSAEREARRLGPRLASGARSGGAVPLQARHAPRPDSTLGSGRPLPAIERRRLEPALGVDLSGVRVHDGFAAKRAAAARHAHAFTFGNHIVLGRAAQDGGPKPRTAVLAHELVHVRQQAVPTRVEGVPRARGPPMPSGFAPPSPAAGARVQCWEAADLVPGFVTDAAGAVADAGSAVVEGAAEAGEAAFDWVLEGVRDAARNLPGYDLLSQVVGRDPITGDRVNAERSALVEAILTYGPFGPAVATVLQVADVLGEVFTTLTDGLVAHGLTLQRVLSDIDAAFGELTLRNGIDANLAIVRRYVSAFLADVLAFVQQIAQRVIEIVRAVVASLAEPLLQTEPIGSVWQLAVQVMHYDPLGGVEVQTPTVDILAGFLRLIGKQDALAQMQERGTLQATADWLDTQLATFTGLIAQLGTLFGNAWAAIQPENLPRLLETLPVLASQAFALVQGVASFAVTVVAKVLELVKTSLLAWLSEYANQVPGFPMITVIIGQNPFTGEVVPRTAENLIRGFVTLLPGGAAMYDSLAESGVIGAAAERIEGAMASLGITVEMVTRTFLVVWDLVTLQSLLTPLTTFAQIVALFGDPIRRILEFVTVVIEVVVTLVLRLMSFPTELLGSIIANTVAAITDIQRDPVGFLLNMVEALKAGFTGFFGNIVTHLTQGLMDWLLRGLGELGITIPSEWSLGAALDLVLQVLGLSVEFLWGKLGEHMGEERVALIRENLDRLSGAWAFIRDVQQRGLAAIWDFVADQLSNLWQTVLSMATEWIMTRVVATATTRLLSMLDPTGVMAVVNSGIAFFNAVQSAIEYLRDMLEIVGMYVSTLAAVAAGNIEPGARMIEQGLAAVIPIAIGFLARQVGLGSMPQRIVEIIQRLREMVERAVDWLIAQALRLGGAVLDALGMGGGGAEAGPERAPGGLPSFDETFDVEGQTHRLYTDASGALWVASDEPEPVSSIEQVRSLLRDIHTAVEQNKRSEIRRLKNLLKQHPEWWIDLTESPQTGHAPNIGEVSRHGSQATRWRPQNVRGRTLPSYLPFWELESEHLIPRAQVDQYFRGLRLSSTTASDYRNMTTIMMYKGASRRKTNAQGGDNRILSTLATRVDAALAGGPAAPGQPQPARTYTELLPVVTPLFGSYIHEAQMRATDAVTDEDLSHDTTQHLTNGEIRDAPPRPTASEIAAAYAEQAGEIDAFLRGRAVT
jgi:hypothetical protein